MCANSVFSEAEQEAAAKNERFAQDSSREEAVQEDSVTNDYLDTLTEVDISSGFSELTPEEEELFLSEDSSGRLTEV